MPHLEDQRNVYILSNDAVHLFLLKNLHARIGIGNIEARGEEITLLEGLPVNLGVERGSKDILDGIC